MERGRRRHAVAEAMSALPPKADIDQRDGHVHLVPEAAMSIRSKAALIRSGSAARLPPAAAQTYPSRPITRYGTDHHGRNNASPRCQGRVCNESDCWPDTYWRQPLPHVTLPG